MWIERLEFIGFGSLTGQRIDFPRGKLCLLSQPNEYGKSTIIEAIWAVLYGYPRPEDSSTADELRKPLSGAAYKACLDLTVDDKQIRLIRDFSAHSLKVLDLTKDPSKADSDITQQFAALLTQEHFGEKLTSLNRELFKTVCVLDQQRIARDQPFSGDRALAGRLLATYDSGATAGNIFEAISALEEKLRLFPFHGKAQPLDGLISNLEIERKQLAEELRRLESERLSCDRDVEQLSAVEDRLSVRTKIVTADEYFHLCLELAEVEDRLSRSQERIQRIKEMEERVRDFASYAQFSYMAASPVNEMWLRRQSRLADLHRLQSEVQAREPQTQMTLKSRERADSLETFTQDDSHMLSALARGLDEVFQEIADTTKKHADESLQVKKQGVDLNALAEARQCLLSLDARELGELHTIYTGVVSFRERTNEFLASAEKAVTSVNEIMRSRDFLVRLTLAFFWPLVGLSTLLIAGLLGLDLLHVESDDPRVSACASALALACAGAAAAWYAGNRVRTAYRVQEENAARLEEQKCRVAVLDLGNKLQDSENRIAELAKKANLDSAETLIDYMQAYSASSRVLKELDFLEYLLRNEKGRAEKLIQEIRPYFVQAKRDPEKITPESANQLAQDVARCLEGKANSQANTGEHRASEIRFLTDELHDEDRLIMMELNKLMISAATVEEAYGQYQERLNGYRKWEMLTSELNRLTDESTGELSRDELTALVERLEAKRSSIWTRMRELIAINPQIANMPPASFSEEITELKASVEKLKQERDELTVAIRAAMRNYQDNYLKSLEKLETVERNLEHLKHTRASLRLARDTFLRLAEEHHALWADRLNELATDLLKQSAVEYEVLQFDPELNLIARRKGQREPFNTWQMANQVSIGARQQLNFTAHLAISTYLSGNTPLPLILDEPFAALDDERFVRNMRLLLRIAGTSKQIIVFSCHQKRHQWLLEQLSPQERELVENCQLTPLKADAGSLARR